MKDTNIWARVDEAIDTDPLQLRDIVSELLRRAAGAEAERDALKAKLGESEADRDEALSVATFASEKAQTVRRERDALKAANERARKIHHPAGPYCSLCDPSYGAGDGSDGNNPACTHHPRYCDVCRGPVYPCPTLAALDAPETTEKPTPERRRELLREMTLQAVDAGLYGEPAPEMRPAPETTDRDRVYEIADEDVTDAHGRTWDPHPFVQSRRVCREVCICGQVPSHQIHAPETTEEPAPCPRCEGSMVEPGTEEDGDWDSAAMRHHPYTGEPCTACNGSGKAAPETTGDAETEDGS